MARLCSRTAMSAAGLSISATEASEPASPKAPAALSHPLGRTPSCFASKATKIRAFCSPKPGSAFTLLNSSAPVAAPVHTAAALPPYSCTSKRQSSCTRAAMDPGKRWSAGRSTNSAVSSSGFMAAISAASRSLPSLWRSTQGPEKAFSRGTCWSRTMPISRASGSSTRYLSASGSPVKGRLLAVLGARGIQEVYGGCIRLLSPRLAWRRVWVGALMLGVASARHTVLRPAVPLAP